MQEIKVIKIYMPIYNWKKNNALIEIQEKWSKNLNDEVRMDTLSNSFRNAKRLSPSVYQHFNQYKLLHRRTVNDELLHKMGIS